MTCVKGRRDIQGYYADQSVSDGYIDRRFVHPLGQLLHDAQVRFVNDVLHDYGVQRVLELAPGPARVAAEVHAPATAVAMDYNANMLRQASRRLDGGADWRLCRGDAFRLPFADAFDLVYTFRFIRHFGRDDRQRVYRQVRAALASGGLLVFDAVNARVSRAVGRRLGTLGHGVYDAMLSRRELLDELDEAGFEPMHLEGVYSHYLLQYWTQIYVGPRSQRLARLAINWLERNGSAEPLEWIVLCRRRS